MSPSPILFDLTEFMGTPLRTGIQRVCFEILARWRGPRPLQPVRLNGDGRVQLLPEETVQAITAYFQAAPPQREASRLRLVALGQQPGPTLDLADLRRYRALCNVELFFNPARVRFYEEVGTQMPDQVFLVVHDFMPQLRPEFFEKGGFLHTLPYVRMLRGLKHLGFVSEATRQEFRQRIVRRPDAGGPVLTWGADGLGVAPPEFVPGRRSFTVVGSLEPRKNPGAVLEAFAALWDRGVEVTLTMVGRYCRLEEPAQRLLERLLREEPRFQYLTEQDDNAVRALIRASRATLFPSLAEGYGIPPLESLALGVPVVVTAGIPSITMIEPLGQVRLARPDSASIQQAVLDLLDDDFARRKYAEIRQLKLPTWDELVQRLSDWIENGR